MSQIGDRLKPGQVRDAIFNYLKAEGQPASVAQITAAVSHSTNKNGDIASSVRSYLNLNTPGTFERTKRGTYQLRLPEHAGYTENSKEASPKPLVPPEFARDKWRIIQSDCISWLQTAEPHSIHGVVTDPPYGLLEYSEEEQDKLRKGQGGVWRIPPSFDGHQRSPLPRFTILSSSDHLKLVAFFQQWASCLLPILVPGAHVVVASNPLVSHLMCNALASAGFEKRGELIRLVMTMRGGDRPKNAHKEFSDVSVMPRSMWEPWLLFRKPLEGRVQDNLRRWFVGGFRRPSAESPFGDVIKSSPAPKQERKWAPHPSIKPQRFLRAVVRAVLPCGRGVVLDPFAGSGSTLAAAEAVGYSSIGIERDAQYFSMAKQAIPNLASMYRDEDFPLLRAMS